MFRHAGLRLLDQQRGVIIVGSDLLQGLDEERAGEMGRFGYRGRATDSDVVDAAVTWRWHGGVVRVDADGVRAGDWGSRGYVLLDKA